MRLCVNNLSRVTVTWKWNSRTGSRNPRPHDRVSDVINIPSLYQCIFELLRRLAYTSCCTAFFSESSEPNRAKFRELMSQSSVLNKFVLKFRTCCLFSKPQRPKCHWSRKCRPSFGLFESL